MAMDAADRRDIGRWLAGLFLRELDAEALALYRSAEADELLDLLGNVAPLAPLVEALRTSVHAADDPETLRLDLAAAYGRVFLTGGPKAVPLHASAYLSERALLMQGPAQETLQALETLGLSLPEGFREPADHVGIQLLILAELAERMAPDGLDEATYLETRLLPYVPTLAALCSKLAPVALYRELGAATLGWLRLVQGQLSAQGAA